MTTYDPPHVLNLTLAPGGDSHLVLSLAGLTGHTDHGYTSVADALVHGAPLDELVQVGTPRASRDVRGVLDVLHARRLLVWQVRGVRGTVWATLKPLHTGRAPSGARAGRRCIKLSRFALMRDAEALANRIGALPANRDSGAEAQPRLSLGGTAGTCDAADGAAHR